MELQLCWASICVHLCKDLILDIQYSLLTIFVRGDDPRKVCMDLWLNPPVCFQSMLKNKQKWKKNEKGYKTSVGLAFQGIIP